MDAELRQLLNQGRAELQFRRERQEFVQQQLPLLERRRSAEEWDQFARLVHLHLTPHGDRFRVTPGDVYCWPTEEDTLVIRVFAEVGLGAVIWVGFHQVADTWTPETGAGGEPLFRVAQWSIDERDRLIESIDETNPSTTSFAEAVALAFEAKRDHDRLCGTAVEMVG